MVVLKWTGGKKQLLDKFNTLFPKDSPKVFYEPFCGSLSVTMWVMEKYPTIEKCIVADANPKLINFYIQVKNNVEDVIKCIDPFRDYYLVRDEFNSDNIDPIKSAGLLFTLNRRCFNGLYRVNKSGKFNTPIGRTNIDWNNQLKCLREFSTKLNSIQIEFHNMDFRTFFNTFNPNSDDLVYVDPPYYGTFVDYTNGGFDEDTQVELFNILKELKCNVLASNSNYDFIKDLYRSKFKIVELDARRTINRNVDDRKSQKVEVLLSKLVS